MAGLAFFSLDRKQTHAIEMAFLHADIAGRRHDSESVEFLGEGVVRLVMRGDLGLLTITIERDEVPPSVAQAPQTVSPPTTWQEDH